MAEVLILNRGATLLNYYEAKKWTITDVFFNLSTREVEFMAKRDGDDYSAIYIPQSKMLEWIDKKILKPVKEGEDFGLEVFDGKHTEVPELEKD